MNDTAKKILITFLGFVSGIIVFSASYLVLVTTHPKLPSNQSEFTQMIPKAFVVYSGSMEPSIMTGAVVFTKPASTYKAEDVITFKSGGNNTTHRIQEVHQSANSTEFVTKGDANDNIDANAVNADKVYGKVVLTVPYLGRVVDFAKTPKGFILLVIVPATILIYEELRKLKHEVKKSVKKSDFFANNSVIASNITSKIVQKKEYDGGATRKLILLPVIGAFVLVISATGAYFSDIETSVANIISGGNTTSVTLNEFLPQPADNTEWVELFNAGDEEIDMTGWRLQNTIDEILALDALGVVAPGSHATIDMADFLPDDTGILSLYNDKNQVVSVVNYDSLPADTSYGRDVDGTGEFKDCTTTTKGVSNIAQC